MEEHPKLAAARRGYAAFAAGDLDTLRDLLAEDVVWHIGGHNPLTGDYKGHDEVFAFFGRIFQETGGTFKIEPHDILANDEHAVVLAQVTAQRNNKTLDQKATYVHHVNAENRTTEFWGLFEDSAAVDDFWS